LSPVRRSSTVRNLRVPAPSTPSAINRYSVSVIGFHPNHSKTWADLSPRESIVSGTHCRIGNGLT